MAEPTSSKVISRAFRDDDDFWRLRQLSLDTYPITPLGWNWDLRRWDGSRFYDAEPRLNPDWQHNIHLWETDEGRLVGAVNGGGQGYFSMQLHPDFRWLEDEMIAWAEANLAVPGEGGAQIITDVYDYDTPRQEFLARRGFAESPEWGVIRRMVFGDRPLPEVRIAEGYCMRAVRSNDPVDCQRIADLLNAAFRRTFHNGMEFFQFARLAPCFRADLHLVAVAGDGSFAAHVAVIYDEVNRRGLFEPVCTHPEHQRKHLAQNLMFQGLHLLRDLGAKEVTVETGDMAPANALYDSLGFTEVCKTHVWRKEKGRQPG